MLVPMIWAVKRSDCAYLLLEWIRPYALKSYQFLPVACYLAAAIYMMHSSMSTSTHLQKTEVSSRAQKDHHYLPGHEGPKLAYYKLKVNCF